VSQKPVLSAFVSFAGPRTVDVHVDTGPGFESGLDEFRLLFLFYAKTMYNLGPTDAASRLRDHLKWAAGAIRAAVDRTPLEVPIITAGHFCLADAGRDVTAGAGAFLEAGADGSRFITTEYKTPPSQEEYYAYVAVLAYLQTLLDGGDAWGNYLIIAVGLDTMNAAYDAGSASWDSLPAILRVPETAVHAGLQALADEMTRRKGL
jgi:hypothetical protein